MVISNPSQQTSPRESRDEYRLLARLRLKHLRLIETLSRVESLRKAAQELNLTQPAATKILQDLEDVLGVELFTRKPRSIVMNDYGHFVALYARRVLRETTRLGTELGTLVRTGHGTLNIGAIMVTAARLLPEAVMEMKQLRPGITVRIVESSSDRLLSDLTKNEFDFVLARFVSAQDPLQFDLQTLHDEPLCIYTSAKKPLLANIRTIADLHGHQWVIQDSPTPTRKLLEEEFALSGLPLPPHVVQTGSVYTMLNLVDKVGMIGVLPRAMVENEGERFRVLPIELKGKLTPFGIITRRETELSQASLEMISILMRLARKLDT